MKNRLLALMALCGATSSTLPLWAAEWENPIPNFVEPNLDTDGTGGGVYYIYHVATQKFITCGTYNKNWGTEVVVADEGKELTLSYDTDYELSNRPADDTEYSNAKGWRFTMWDGKSNTGRHELYYSPSDNAFCVDHNKQGHMLWKISPVGDGNYRIKISDEDPTYGLSSEHAVEYVGLVDETRTGVDAFINPEMAGNEKAQLDWRFVTPEAYEVLLAKRVLKKWLVSADEAGYTSYEEYDKVYQDAAATLEDVEAASAGLKKAVFDFKFSGASEEHPADVTDVIENPAFDNGSTGWDTQRDAISGQDNFGVAGSTQNTSDGTEFKGFFERWTATNPQTSWSITQEINDIPDGRYRLSAYILTNVKESDGGPKGRYLYAKSKGGEVKLLATVPSPDGAGYAAPYTLEFSVIGGSATVGLKVETPNSQWTGVDNFKLEYLGEAGAMTMQDYLKEHIADAEKTYEAYKSANKKMSQKGEEAYTKLIGHAKEVAADASVDIETVSALIETLQKQMDVMAKDVAAYDKLEQLLVEAENKYWASPYEDMSWPTLEDYIDNTLKVEQGDCSFDPALIDSVQPRMDRYYMEDFRAAALRGEIEDFTPLLVNANFTNNANGWQGGSGHGVETGEMYDKQTFDVYQEIEGLPEGSYEVSLQGFQRPTWHDACQTAWGTDAKEAQVTAYAYGNDGSVKLHHCYDEVFDEPMQAEGWGKDVQLSLPNDELRNGKYALDALTGTHKAFEEGHFENKFVCYVKADGKLRVGVRMTEDAGLSGDWTTYDNFRLKYLGAEDMSGAVSALEARIADAKVLLDDVETLTTKAAKDALQKAIADATAALEAELTQESYAVNSEALNAAIELETESRAAAAKLETTAAGHDNKFNGAGGTAEYDKYAGTDEYDVLLELVSDEVLLAIDERSLADLAQIEGFMQRMNEAYCKMVATQVDFNGASKDAPVDVTGMITNPSFEEMDADTQEKASSNAGWECNKVHDNLKAADLVYEIFGLGDVKLYQTVYALPKGYYRLTYNGFYRGGDAVPAALVRRDSTEEVLNAKVYVETASEKLSVPLASIFDNVTLYSYDSGDMVLADSLFPDMPDMMYHTIVNGRVGARKAFEDNAYEGAFSFEVKEDGEGVTIGVEKDEVITNDWTCFDNFHLYYLGAGEANRPDDIPDGVEDAVADGKATVVSSAWYTINGVRVAEPKQRGIYIRQDKMSDGTTKSVKVMVR